MSSVVIKGDTSGQITLSAPAVAGTNTLTLPTVTSTLATEVNGALYPLTSGTAVASTSGTSIDFTSIPSWVKRVTVIFQGVSLSATANLLVQIGSGSFTTSGYSSIVSNKGGTTATSTSGFISTQGSGATGTWNGSVILLNITSNTWVANSSLFDPTGTSACYAGGNLALGGTLDRVRITSTGADTFDAGSINIMYE